MKAKQVGRIIELEERVSDICTSLVIVEVDHFNVEYTEFDISIIAFTHDEAKVSVVNDVMRKYSKPDDVLETREILVVTGKFWTIDLHIGL